MIGQRWIAVALLALSLGFGACDGGSSGTGITTAQGNIVSIASGMAAGTDLAGIRVSVEGTSAADDTDASGAFAVKGSFDGRVTLLFERSADGLLARLPINVPSLGTLTLDDVTLDQTSGTADAALWLLEFEGVVDGVDCNAGEIAFVSTPGDPDAYIVDVAGSTLQSKSGAPVACSDVQVGEKAAIDGTVEKDGSIGSAAVRFEQ